MASTGIRSGIETVTVVLDGALEHGDNRGSAGVLEPGDVQCMTAGSGIIHRELAFKNEHAHTLQLWLNLPHSHKFVDARNQDLRAATRPAVPRPVTGHGDQRRKRPPFRAGGMIRQTA